MTKLRHLNISLESIAFQGDAYLKELALILEPYIGVKKTKVDYLKLSEQIEKTIKKYTNASITIDISPGYSPCIMLDVIDPNSVFSELWGLYGEVPDQYSPTLADLKKIKKTSGKVDLQKSRVEGVFAKKLCTMYFGPELLQSGKYSALEMAAIILHENGHFFGVCEYLDRTTATNQVLATLDRILKNTTDVKTREVAIEYAGSALDVDERIVKQAQNTRDDSVVTTILVASSNINTKGNTSQNSHGRYDLNTPEYTSDEFAARHGAGPYLVTGLDKLLTEHTFFGIGPVQKRNTAVYLGMELLKTVIFAATVVAAPILPHFIIIGLVTLMADQSGMGEPTYDDPITRFRRIRNQLIEMSKLPKLTNEQIVKIKEDLALIDSVYTKYSDRRDFLTYVIELGGLRPSIKNREYQKELEKLAMNEMFIKAIEFKS